MPDDAVPSDLDFAAAERLLRLAYDERRRRDLPEALAAAFRD